MGNVILTGANGWSLPSAGFVNPSYISGPAGQPDPQSAVGFDISAAESLCIAFEGTYAGQTVTHQQTMDQAGLTGWFPISGTPVGTSGTSSTGASTSGVVYVFPALGARHRVLVSAIASGAMVVRMVISETPLAVVTAAGGSSGIVQLNTFANPTVTASSAYASGNSVGGLLTFANGVRFAGGTGLVQSALLQFKSAQSGNYDLILFSSNPANSTIADKTAFSLAVADYNKVIGAIPISYYTSLGTPSVAEALNLALPVISTTTSLFGALVTRSTPTFASTSDVQVTLQVIPD